ncbi:MAG: META domain-containing protein [Ideonella sp. WA131b]|jgi:heat shock protein HslJ|nr:META domain-containing protein [Ideonella sp. WA131b]
MNHRLLQPGRWLALPALLAALTACAAPASRGGGEALSLRGTSWQLGADGPRAAIIRLDEREPHFAGNSGCNRIMGRIVLEGPRLRFENIVGTRRACLDDDGAEDRFLAALAGVRGWRIEGGALKLLAEGGGTLLNLHPGKAAP